MAGGASRSSIEIGDPGRDRDEALAVAARNFPNFGEARYRKYHERNPFGAPLFWVARKISTGAPVGMITLYPSELAMAGELRHRGPDSDGLYLDGRAGMVATRLAIVDLEGGDHPLPDGDARFRAGRNGEIYNHIELHSELEELGHRFAPTSDTEVVAHAHARWGPACLDRLNGDFAIAAWDRDRQELFLARDRLGVRPPFVAELAGGLAMLRAFYARGLTDTGDPLYSHRIRFANTSRCLCLVRPEVLREAARQGDPPGQANYLEIATFLTGYPLHSQGDRMLMGTSVEGRFPYLDHRVAKLPARLPDSLELRGLREKAPLVPPEIAARPKRPYRAPIGSAFFGPVAPSYVGELLRPAVLDEAGIFRPEAVARLAEKCRERSDDGFGKADEMAIVGILSVMLLHEQLVARPAAAVSARPDRMVVGAPVDVGRSAHGEAA